ncbi:MAG: stage V sporulation protein AC [Eubacteriales bacterium]|jgi:stage V sporulation protein AC
MNIGNKEYKKYVEAHAQKSPCVKNCVHAFLSGGAICCAAQGLTQLYKSSGVTESLATSITSVTLIFITALLTGLGVFDNIAKWAGAGTLVPITGFANSVVSPALDNKAEGWVMGVGAKIFTVAGPVILYGTLAGAIYGVIYAVFIR